jgi:hypothetical protein
MRRFFDRGNIGLFDENSPLLGMLGWRHYIDNEGGQTTVSKAKQQILGGRLSETGSCSCILVHFVMRLIRIFAAVLSVSSTAVLLPITRWGVI